MVAAGCQPTSGARPIALRGPALRRLDRAGGMWSATVLRIKVQEPGMQVLGAPPALPAVAQLSDGSISPFPGPVGL